MQQNNLSVYEQIKKDSYSLGTFVLPSESWVESKLNMEVKNGNTGIS
jgi:hypothetical protein